MFTITDEPKFSHTVPIQVPVDGGHREEAIRATYRVMPVDAMQRFDLADAGGTQAFLQAALVRIDDLVDANKQPVPYSDEIRDRLLQLPYVRRALCDAYFDAVSKAKQGN